MKNIEVIGMMEEMDRLRSKDNFSCRDMDRVKEVLFDLKSRGFTAARVSYDTDYTLGIVVRPNQEALICRAGEEAIVPAGKNNNWAEGKLVVVSSNDGYPYLCLGGLAPVSDPFLERGICWIWQGSPARVKLCFWLQNREHLPLSQKIPGLISKSERFVNAALNRTFQLQPA